MRTANRLVMVTMFALLLAGCAAVQSLPTLEERQGLARQPLPEHFLGLDRDSFPPRDLVCAVG